MKESIILEAAAGKQLQRKISCWNAQYYTIKERAKKYTDDFFHCSRVFTLNEIQLFI
jgi:hypothetical protein